MQDKPSVPPNNDNDDGSYQPCLRSGQRMKITRTPLPLRSRSFHVFEAFAGKNMPECPSSSPSLSSADRNKSGSLPDISSVGLPLVSQRKRSSLQSCPLSPLVIDTTSDAVFSSGTVSPHSPLPPRSPGPFGVRRDSQQKVRLTQRRARPTLPTCTSKMVQAAHIAHSCY